MRCFLPAAAVALCVTAAGCGDALAHGAHSPEALATAVADAIAARDEAALRRLALDEQEFRAQVWPELPASRPERNTPFGFVWTDLKTKSDVGLDGVLTTHGGRRYTVKRVRFKGTTQYESFLVHRDSIVDVTDQTGRSESQQLFGSVIEKGGRFKVFSYVVD